MTPQNTFVYGTFRWPLTGILPFVRIGSKERPRESDYAIEVLREFSASELRGKLYFRPLNSNWVPVTIDKLRSTVWYKIYEQRQKDFVFDMEGSGPWEILYFRNESDETGTYLALALRHLPEPPAWVLTQRKREKQSQK